MNFLPVWPWNLTDDLEKYYGTSPKQHQALCIILSSYINSEWSYSSETAKLGFDLCDLDHWPLTLTFCMTSLLSLVITPENFMMIWWQDIVKKVLFGIDLDLENGCFDHHKTKNVQIIWLIYFMYELDHWPCLWHWLWIFKVKSLLIEVEWCICHGAKRHIFRCFGTPQQWAHRLI